MKICTYCYADNDDDAFECCECHEKFDDMDSHYINKSSYIIVCPICNHIYNVSNENDRIDFCSQCGEDTISSELPIEKKCQELCIYFERKATKEKYEIPASKPFILGRGQPGKINNDSFKSEKFSRNECIIEYVNGLWLIHTENNHGHLFINGMPIPSNVKRTLNNNDLVTIFTCKFRVV